MCYRVFKDCWIQSILIKYISEMSRRHEACNKLLFKAGVTPDFAENLKNFATLTGYFQLCVISV